MYSKQERVSPTDLPSSHITNIFIQPIHAIKTLFSSVLNVAHLTTELYQLFLQLLASSHPIDSIKPIHTLDDLPVPNISESLSDAGAIEIVDGARSADVLFFLLVAVFNDLLRS